MSRLKALFKELGILKREGATEEELAALEKKIEEVEAGLIEDAKKDLAAAKGEPGKKGDKGEPGEPGKLDPETQKLIDEMKAENQKLTERLDKRDADEKTAAEKAQAAEYTTYVTQLAKEGKITRARKEELLKEENVKANAPALNSFKAGTADLKPDPKIAAENEDGTPAQKEPEKKEEPAKVIDNTPRPFGNAMDLDKMKGEASKEFAAIMD